MFGKLFSLMMFGKVFSLTKQRFNYGCEGKLFDYTFPASISAESVVHPFFNHIVNSAKLVAFDGYRGENKIKM